MLHTKDLFLRCIRISNISFIVHAGSSRHIQKSAGKLSSCTGFCRCHSHHLLFQKTDHRLFQCHILFGRINGITKTLLHLFDHRLHQFFCRFFRAGSCSHTKMYLSCLCIRRKRRIGLCIHQIRNHGLCPAFPDPAHFYHMGIDSLRLLFIEVRCNVVFKHRFHLIRRPRDQDRCFAALFILQDQSRCRSVQIVDHDRAFRNQRLLPVILCHLFALNLLKIVPDSCPGMFIHIKFSAKYLCSYFFCQIILGRSKSPCQNYDISALYCLADCFFHTLFIVADNSLVI